MGQEPSDESVTLGNLRNIRGWGQKKLAAEAGLEADTISVYERKRCSLKQLHRLGRVMDFTPELVERELAVVRDGRARQARSGDASREEAASQEIEATAAQEGRRYEEFLRSSLRQYDRATEVLLERRLAPRLWAWLQRHPETEWREILETDQDFWSWGLVELVCDVSIDAALVDPNRAEKLADLALLIARRVSGGEALRAAAESYAWGFVANARRVRGHLRQADEAFARSDALWPASADAESIPLDYSRLLDLKASLRRAQRRLPEALDLLDRAFKLARTDRALGRILVLKAKTLEETNDYAGAITALRQATPCVERAGDLRLLLNLRFNLLENEVQEGRRVDVPRRLAEVRDLAIQLGHDLDLIRLRWLEGRLWASSGRRTEAKVAFQSVGEEFNAREMYYDVALVLLELAILLLEESCPREVRKLASQMEVIFRAQGVHREAITALVLFHRSALQEQATVELTRNVLAYLRRSRSNPDLRFELPSQIEPPSPEDLGKRGSE